MWGSNEIVEYDDVKKTCETVVANATLKGEAFASEARLHTKFRIHV